MADEKNRKQKPSNEVHAMFQEDIVCNFSLLNLRKWMAMLSIGRVGMFNKTIVFIFIF